MLELHCVSTAEDAGAVALMLPAIPVTAMPGAGCAPVRYYMCWTTGPLVGPTVGTSVSRRGEGGWEQAVGRLTLGCSAARNTKSPIGHTCLQTMDYLVHRGVYSLFALEFSLVYVSIWTAKKEGRAAL